MTLLTAFIAFAVTMLILSTMVTAIVQIAHEARRMRQRHLNRLVRELFDQVVWPRFGAALTTSAANTELRRIETTVLQNKDPLALTWLDRVFEGTTGRFKGLSVGPKLLIGPVIGTVIVGLAAALALLGGIELFVVIAIVIYWLVDRSTDRRQNAAPRVKKMNGADDEPHLSIAHKELRFAFVREMTTVVGASQRGHRRANHLSNLDLATRLARTEIGCAIMKQGEDKAQELIYDMVRQFELLGKGAKTSFAELSRKWSVWIAFALALAVNVDVITLLKQYIENPEVAARVEKMGEAAATNYTEQLEKLQVQEKTLRNEIKAEKAADKDSETKNREKLLAAVEQQIKATHAGIELQLDSLTGAGVRIGRDYYPYCSGTRSSEMDPRCKSQKTMRDTAKDTEFYKHFGILESRSIFGISIPAALITENVKSFLLEAYVRVYLDLRNFSSWLIGVLLGGALIGLGGPFWFDAYRKLAGIGSMLRGLGLGSRGQADEAKSGDQKPPAKDPETAHAPENVAKAFAEAARANAIIPATTHRPIRGTDGRPLAP